jgi:hypothetical protein
MGDQPQNTMLAKSNTMFGLTQAANAKAVSANAATARSTRNMRDAGSHDNSSCGADMSGLKRWDCMAW